MKTCPLCGVEIRETDNICPSCGAILSKEKKPQTKIETNYNYEKKAAPSVTVTANYNCAEAAKKLATWYRVFRVFYLIGMVSIGMALLILLLIARMNLILVLLIFGITEAILYIGYLFIEHHIEFYDEQYALNTALAALISENSKRK